MKHIDKAALVLIVLAIISSMAGPIVRRLVYLNPALPGLLEYQIATGALTGILSLTLGIGIGCVTV